MKVKDIMTHNVITVKSDMTTIDAVKKMEEQTIHHLLVEDENGELAGILSSHDFPSVISLLAKSEKAVNDFLKNIKAHQELVKDVMKEAPVTVSPDMTLREVAKLMLWHNFHSLPVVQDKKILGIVTDRNILTAFGEIDE